MTFMPGGNKTVSAAQLVHSARDRDPGVLLVLLFGGPASRLRLGEWTRNVTVAPPFPRFLREGGSFRTRRILSRAETRQDEMSHCGPIEWASSRFPTISATRT